MGKIATLIQQAPSAVFLSFTFSVSLLGFFLMITVKGAQSPESSTGFPIWLLAIWGPTLAAIIVWAIQKNLWSHIKIAFSWPPVSGWLLIVVLPFLVMCVLLAYHHFQGHVIVWSRFKLSYLLPLLLLHLLMGPLGEELGWRGFLYPQWKVSLGWLGSALVVGVIWVLWHAPLWWIDSPQAQLPFWAFAINVLCLSILMSIMHNHAQGSVLPAIILHLTFNVSAAIIAILGTHEAGEYYVKSLYVYVPLTLVLLGMHEFYGKEVCSTLS